MAKLRKLLLPALIVPPNAAQFLMAAMAKPTTRRWTAISIWPGDGASPEDFTSKVCGLTTKSFRIGASTSDSEVPDCDDPDAPVWVERVMRARTATIAGSGVLAEETHPFWRDWALTGEAKNCRVAMAFTVPGYFYGRFVLTQYEMVGNLDGGKLTNSLELQSDGPIAWQAGSP